VPDPYYGAMDGFDQVLDMLDKACRHMHNQYSPGLFIK
jgi:protein-tyrosine-phosphatase